MKREDALKVLEIAATLAAASMTEEERAQEGGRGLAMEFQNFIAVVITELDELENPNRAC